MKNTVFMNDETAKLLLKYIAKNMQTESYYRYSSPPTTVEITGLLDEISVLRGIDKRVNGIEFNAICDEIK